MLVSEPIAGIEGEGSARIDAAGVVSAALALKEAKFVLT